MSSDGSTTIKTNPIAQTTSTVSVTQTQVAEEIVVFPNKQEGIADKSKLTSEKTEKVKKLEEIKLKLKYLSGDEEAIKAREKKENLHQKIAGITGGVVGGVSMGLLCANFVKDVGLLGLAIAGPFTLAAVGIIGGVAAAVVGGLYNYKHKQEAANSEEEIKNLQQEIYILETEISQIDEALRSAD